MMDVVDVGVGVCTRVGVAGAGGRGVDGVPGGGELKGNGEPTSLTWEDITLSSSLSASCSSDLVYHSKLQSF